MGTCISNIRLKELQSGDSEAACAAIGAARIAVFWLYTSGACRVQGWCYRKADSRAACRSTASAGDSFRIRGLCDSKAGEL